MSVDISKSESDVSSNSSWTVIEDDQKPSKENASNSEPDQEVDIEVIKTTEIVTIPDSPKSEEHDFVKISLPNQSSDEDNTDGSKDETKENGFLTFDEYLQERMLEHDYEYPNQSIFKTKLRKTKNNTKEKKKCKAEAVGVLSLCASLLTVTGIALLCLIFPESVDSNNFESIKSNYQSIVNNDSLEYANIASTFNRTMEILDITNNTKLLAKCADSLLENAECQPYKRNFGPLPEIKKSKYRLQRRLGGRFTRDNIFRNDMCYPRSQNHCYESDNPKFQTDQSKHFLQKTTDRKKTADNISTNETNKPSRNSGEMISLSAIQAVLANSNLRNIIRSIIHDLCMLKLVTYFNQTKVPQEQKKKSNKSERKASKRKLLEAIADGITKITLESSKCRKIRTAKRRNEKKKREQPAVESRETALSIINDTNEDVAKDSQHSNSKCVTVVPNKLLDVDIVTKIENGKSECERRFEELDSHRKKSKEVSSQHKTNIQQIKHKYRSEIDAIKGSNVEPLVRLHKMQTVRENYRLQLKKNREFYMREMCKMKRIRAKLLKDLCAQKNIDREVKDVSVGNYVVPIGQDFHSCLKKMREKEKPFSSTTFVKLQDDICMSNSENISPFNIDSKITTDTLLFQEPSLADPSKNEIMVKPRMVTNFKKSTSKQVCSDIPSMFGLSFNFDMSNTEETCPQLSSVKKDQEQWNQEVGTRIGRNKHYSEESEDVESAASGSKRNIPGQLYHLAFEKRGETIKKSDTMKWRQQRIEQWEKYRKDITKQNPEKSFKPNIVVYKY